MEKSVAISTKQVAIKKISQSTNVPFTDTISVEEPLEIRIGFGAKNERRQKSISVTMRTPGNDLELATGFLFTEGIINSYSDVEEPMDADMEHLPHEQNIVQVALAEGFIPHLQQSDRNFYTTSSCGVCGKSSIQSVKTVNAFCGLEKKPLHLAAGMLYTLPQKLRAAQNDFTATGGIHASALFTMEGELLLLREDVGRHNALDKLIGASLMNHALPLNEHILLLSGRASFELVQKAAMAGISIIAAIGAPSSLAIDTAKEFDITLIGFLRENRCNIYHAGNNVLIQV